MLRGGVSPQQAIGAAERAPLKVVHLSPVDSVEGQRETVKILVGFNQVMVPLQAVPREETQGPLLIQPAIKGKYRWFGTKTLAFIPSDTLPPEASYQITLVADKIQSLSGARLEKDTTWSFRTWGVNLLTSVPYEGSDFVDTKAYIFLLFNMAMPADRVQANIRITATHGKPSPSYCAGGTVVRAFPEPQEPIPFKVRHLTEEELKSPNIRYSNWAPEKAWAIVPQRPFPVESEIAVHFLPGLITGGNNPGSEETPGDVDLPDV